MSYTLEYYVHSLAHAEKLVPYEVHTPITHGCYCDIYNAMDAIISKRQQWDNDGFNQFISFRMTNEVTGEFRIARYDYFDTTRSFERTI